MHQEGAVAGIVATTGRAARDWRGDCGPGSAVAINQRAQAETAENAGG